jgi:hypothetical protein
MSASCTVYFTFCNINVRLPALYGCTGSFPSGILPVIMLHV